MGEYRVVLQRDGTADCEPRRTLHHVWAADAKAAASKWDNERKRCHEWKAVEDEDQVHCCLSRTAKLVVEAMPSTSCNPLPAATAQQPCCAESNSNEQHSSPPTVQLDRPFVHLVPVALGQNELLRVDAALRELRNGNRYPLEQLVGEGTLIPYRPGDPVSGG